MKRKPIIPVVIALLLILAGLSFMLTISGHLYIGAGLIALGVVILLYVLVRKKRGLTVILTILLLVCLAAFAAAEAPVIRAAKTDAPEDTEFLIVLGAGVNGTTPSMSLMDRLRATLTYMETHPDTLAIVTGSQGHGEDISEARAMYTYLTEHGIAPERIILEEQADNTRQNIRYSFDLLEAMNRDTGRVAVLSSEYHLYRAKRYAASMGYSVTGVAARTSMTTLRINYFIREAFASAYIFVFGL